MFKWVNWASTFTLVSISLSTFNHLVLLMALFTYISNISTYLGLHWYVPSWDHQHFLTAFLIYHYLKTHWFSCIQSHSLQVHKTQSHEIKFNDINLFESFYLLTIPFSINPMLFNWTWKGFRDLFPTLFIFMSWKSL